MDCGVDTGKIHEYYFIHTALWLSVVTNITGMLCIGCLETRLGRELQPSDFTSAHINNPKGNMMSVRLLSRLRHKNGEGIMINTASLEG